MTSTDSNGLSSQEAERLLSQFGRNEIVERENPLLSGRMDRASPAPRANPPKTTRGRRTFFMISSLFLFRGGGTTNGGKQEIPARPTTRLKCFPKA